MPGQLFTQYFLTDGMRTTPERRAQAPAFAAFRDAAHRLFQDFAGYHNSNETQTEQDLIRPLLQLLGWTDDLPQQTSSGGEDTPDLLLFADPQTKNRAGDHQTNSYLKAVTDGHIRWGILTSRAVWRLYDQPVAQGLARCLPEAISVIRGYDGPSFGRFCTKDLILAYMNALAAGDTDAKWRCRRRCV